MLKAPKAGISELGAIMAVPTSSALAKQLFHAAEMRAVQHGLGFGPGAGNALRAMAAKAAKTILKTAQTKPHARREPYIKGAARVAAEAMTTFVDEMTSARLRIPGYVERNKNLIGEETFKTAREVLCPLWPIC